jgi:hypothetical protein
MRSVIEATDYRARWKPVRGTQLSGMPEAGRHEDCCDFFGRPAEDSVRTGLPAVGHSVVTQEDVTRLAES